MATCSCEANEHYLPLYEAKLFHQYDHRFATFDGVSDGDRENGNARLLTVTEKTDPERLPLPRYWVPEEEVAPHLDKSDGYHIVSTQPNPITSPSDLSPEPPTRAPRYQPDSPVSGWDTKRRQYESGLGTRR